MGRRHADVDNREVRPVLANQAQELRPVARLTDDLVPRLLEQAREPLPQQDIVVCDDHAPIAEPAGLACHPWGMRNVQATPPNGDRAPPAARAAASTAAVAQRTISSASSGGQPRSTRLAMSC